MGKVLLVSVALALVTSPCFAVIGETWVLPIYERREQGWAGWTQLPGAGYEGTDAWEGSGWNGVARIYWQLSGTGSMGNEPPQGVRLYTIEFWAPTSGATEWQPIESALNGVVNGETYPIEPGIPWDGMYGTNHQWIGSDGSNDGQWHPTGPGPHNPNGPEPDAAGDAPDSFYMWLKKDSGLYVKWDFGWSITRAWSAIRLTQVTTAGSCCLPDGSCLDDVEPDDCTNQGGTHQGYGSTCSQGLCAEASGACCLSDTSACVELTDTECTALGGVFHGYYSLCSDHWADCCRDPFADVDGDEDVDHEDFAVFQACFTGMSPPPGSFDLERCGCLDADGNGAVDEDDFAAFESCASGPDIPASVTCDDVPASP